MFASQQFRRRPLQLRVMSDCHSFGSGAFSMPFATLEQDFPGLTFGTAKLLGSRVGSRRGDETEPFFRLNPRSEGGRSSAPASLAGVAERASRTVGAPTQAPIPGIDCGKVTNRTSGPYGSVRPLHLNSYSAGTRPRPKRRPHTGSGPSTDRHRCSFEETKKREFQRQAQVSAHRMLARTGVCWGSIDFA